MYLGLSWYFIKQIKVTVLVSLKLVVNSRALGVNQITLKPVGEHQGLVMVLALLHLVNLVGYMCLGIGSSEDKLRTCALTLSLELLS